MTGRKRSFTRGRDGGNNRRAWTLAAIYANLLLQNSAGDIATKSPKALQDERGLLLSDENKNVLIAF